MKDFPRPSQDRIVRQISASGAVRRCHILLEVLDHVDPLVTPLVIDEIGVTADREALGRLLTIADGDLPPNGGAYLRVKAIEALGRIRATESASTLKRLGGGEESIWMGRTARSAHWPPSRPLRDSIRTGFTIFLPKSGIDNEDFTLAPLEIPATVEICAAAPHHRVRFEEVSQGSVHELKEGCSLEVKTASLTGALQL